MTPDDSPGKGSRGAGAAAVPDPGAVLPEGPSDQPPVQSLTSVRPPPLCVNHGLKVADGRAPVGLRRVTPADLESPGAFLAALITAQQRSDGLWLVAGDRETAVRVLNLVSCPVKYTFASDTRLYHAPRPLRTAEGAVVVQSPSDSQTAWRVTWDGQLYLKVSGRTAATTSVAEPGRVERVDLPRVSASTAPAADGTSGAASDTAGSAPETADPSPTTADGDASGTAGQGAAASAGTGEWTVTAASGRALATYSALDAVYDDWRWVRAPLVPTRVTYVDIVRAYYPSPDDGSLAACWLFDREPSSVRNRYTDSIRSFTREHLTQKEDESVALTPVREWWQAWHSAQAPGPRPDAEAFRENKPIGIRIDRTGEEWRLPGFVWAYPCREAGGD